MSAILDTCVISELYEANAEPAVVYRVIELGALSRGARGACPSHERADAHLSVITIGELFRGTQELEAGCQQRTLLESLRRTERRFATRTLGIGAAIARCWRQLAAETLALFFRGSARSAARKSDEKLWLQFHVGGVRLIRSGGRTAPNGVASTHGISDTPRGGLRQGL